MKVRELRELLKILPDSAELVHRSVSHEQGASRYSVEYSIKIVPYDANKLLYSLEWCDSEDSEKTPFQIRKRT